MVDIDKCKITHYPQPVLREKAKPVENIDDNIREFVEKMKEIMVETKGIGLAAPQAGVNLQIFIISLTGKAEDAKVFINPEVKQTGPMDSAEEGCLSVPGIYTKIRRSKTCTVSATDLDGNRFTEDAEGLYARCLQHEYDHLQGITIANKMSKIAKIANRKQLENLRQEYEKKS